MAEALEVQLKADISSFATAMNQANQSLLKLVEGTRKTSQATNQMANTLKGIGAGIAAAFAGKAIQALQALSDQFVALAEAPTKFKASLEALTGSSKRAQDMLQRVYQVAKRTGTGFEDTAALVQRLTIGLNALGANNAQIAQIAENILKLGTIGGSSIADTAAAAQQLSQALASGKLQGDELRSIMERMPTLAQILAKEMGVSVGELKKLGAEGKITADIMANALLKATNQINADFAKMPLTVGQAMNNVKTSIQQAFDNPAAVAAVQALARGINQIAVVVGVADRAVRQFVTGLSSFGRSMANLFEPVVNMLQKLVQGFQNLGTAIGPALTPIKGILTAVFLGPLVTIISKWDELAAYFTNKVPAMFYSMVGAAQEGMAGVVGVFNNGFQKLVQIAQSAINAIVNGLNLMSSKINEVAGFFGSGPLVNAIGDVKLQFGDLTNTMNGWRAAAEGNFKIASGYAQRYATDLRTIARSQAEQTSLAEAGTNANNDLAAAFKNVTAAADGTGGGGGKGGGGSKGGGGAAGGIKKAGDAAKKAAADMKSAQSQVEEFGQAMQGIAQSLGSGVVDALFSIADGSKSAKEAFSELAKSMLKQIAQMIVQMLILKPLMGMFGGGLGGGLGLFGGGGGGLFSRSVSVAAFGIGSSRTNRAVGDYTGFNLQPGVAAMRSAMSSAGNTNMPHAAPMQVTINNSVEGASVKTRRGNNGQLEIDFILDVMSDALTRGGNKVDQAMSRAYGARRVGY